MDITVLHAEQHHANNRLWWVLEVEVDRDGITDRATHVLPIDAVEWRAAEYGLDPVADHDEVLAIVLAEPHVPAPDDTDVFQLWNAPTVADARAALRARHAHVRVTGQVGPPPATGSFPGGRVVLRATATDDPLDVLRAERADRARVAIMAEHITAQRAQLRRQRRTRTGPARQSAEQLRSALMPSAPQPKEPHVPPHQR